MAALCLEASSFVPLSSADAKSRCLTLAPAQSNIQNILKEGNAVTIDHRQALPSFSFIRVISSAQKPDVLSFLLTLPLQELSSSSRSYQALWLEAKLHRRPLAQKVGRFLWYAGEIGGKEGQRSGLNNDKRKKKKTFNRSESSSVNISTEPLDLEQVLQLLEEGKLRLSVHELLRVLYKCRATKEFRHLLRLYVFLCAQRLETQASLGNYLVLTLVEFGKMHEALELFSRLQDRHQSSCNSLITGFAKSGDIEHAFSLFSSMCLDGIMVPDRHTLAALLKICAKLKDFKRGFQLHVYIKNMDLYTNDEFIGSALIDMYAKCGLVKNAQDVFDKLLSPDVVTWNALIGGYASQGYPKQVLDCFEQMKMKGVLPNAITFISLLKVCLLINNAHIGLEIHCHMTKLGLMEDNVVLGNAVVDMYAKLGQLTTAHNVFDGLAVRDVISWTTLITAYIEADLYEQALECYEMMQLDGISPNAVTYMSRLKACANLEAAELGKTIHAELVCKGLDEKHTIRTALIDMYAKCGAFDTAKGLFGKLLVQDVLPWNNLVVAYIKHNHPEEALHCYKQMRANGITADGFTFACCLQACGMIKAPDKGEELYAEIAEQGIQQQETIVGNALVDMYAKCGLLKKAQDVFDRLPIRTIVGWNALIGGYAEQHRSDKAIKYLKEMQIDGVCPDSVTLTSCLGACGTERNLDQGQELHKEASRRDLIQDHLVNNALVDMYCKCGSLESAEEVFNNIIYRDVVCWTTIIAGCVELGYDYKALGFFKQMIHEATSPDSLAVAWFLRACGNAQDIRKGFEICAQIVRERWFKDAVVTNALSYMYVKCGLLAEAQKLFDSLTSINVAAWNILLAGYAEHGNKVRALRLREEMLLEGVHPTYVLFETNSSFSAPDMIKQLYAKSVKVGLDTQLVIGSALINAFSKCGLLLESQDIFDRLPVRDEVTWTSLIVAYAEHEQGEEALCCLHLMKVEGFSLDAVSFACCLQACGSIGALSRGQELHDQIRTKVFLQDENILGRALLDMYAKCGMMEKAIQIFDKLLNRNVIAWSTLIAGYAQFGEVENVSNLVNKMTAEGQHPNSVTYLSLLTACAHAGMIANGQMYFQCMESHHGVVPHLQHYNCIIDLLRRAGQVEEAHGVIENMSLICNDVMWQMVSGACQKLWVT